MDKQRQGEIAIAFLKEMHHRRGQRTLDEMREQVDAVAEKTNIPAEEVRQFVGIIDRELVLEWHERQRLQHLQQPFDTR